MAWRQHGTWSAEAAGLTRIRLQFLLHDLQHRTVTMFLCCLALGNTNFQQQRKSPFILSHFKEFYLNVYTPEKHFVTLLKIYK